jgi:hypothetical protein
VSTDIDGYDVQLFFREAFQFFRADGPGFLLKGSLQPLSLVIPSGAAWDEREIPHENCE